MMNFVFVWSIEVFHKEEFLSLDSRRMAFSESFATFRIDDFSDHHLDIEMKLFEVPISAETAFCAELAFWKV